MLSMSECMYSTGASLSCCTFATCWSVYLSGRRLHVGWKIWLQYMTLPVAQYVWLQACHLLLAMCWLLFLAVCMLAVAQDI
jgi:hypothetical protein